MAEATTRLNPPRPPSPPSPSSSPVTAIGSHVARRAMAIEATAPRLDAGMWYSDDLQEFARAHGARLSPRDVMPGRVSTDAFERLPRRFGLYALRLKPYHSAQAALRRFIAGPTVTECGNWLLALQYEAILQAMGDAAFDAYFGSVDADVPQSRRLLLNHPNFGPLQPMWREMEISNRDVKVTVDVGDLVHFCGVTDYRIKHPLGVAGGWNLVCCQMQRGTPLFVGQGIGRPRGAHAMAALLREAYDAPRTGAERLIGFLRPFKHGVFWRDRPAHKDRLAHKEAACDRMPRITRLWRLVPPGIETLLQG